MNRDPLDDPDAKKDPAAAPPEPSEGDTGQQSGRPQPEQDRRERTEQHVSGYGGAKGEPKDGGRTG
jgi:hypothetical protein